MVSDSLSKICFLLMGIMLFLEGGRGEERILAMVTNLGC